MTTTKIALVAFAFGLLGLITGFLLWHSYNDHLAVHAIINSIQQAQTQRTQPKE